MNIRFGALLSAFAILACSLSATGQEPAKSPTPEEIDAFLNDDSPDAFDRVVERLLQSPDYGVRWGRHWLDVARYADSNGLDENLGFGQAWRYRDYVIRSFNDDKPFDLFVKEQLAGDDLRPGDPDGIITTACLRMAPWGTAMIAKAKARQI